MTLINVEYGGGRFLRMWASAAYKGSPLSPSEVAGVVSRRDQPLLITLTRGRMETTGLLWAHEAGAHAVKAAIPRRLGAPRLSRQAKGIAAAAKQDKCTLVVFRMKVQSSEFTGSRVHRTGLCGEHWGRAPRHAATIRMAGLVREIQNGILSVKGTAVDDGSLSQISRMHGYRGRSS